MLTGYLRSKDTSNSENTVAKVTKKIYPYHAFERYIKAARNLNPRPYCMFLSCHVRVSK